ncbi:MAG: hypothetical protein V1869_06605 [Candidatus Omnitrophota bacterium]
MLNGCLASGYHRKERNQMRADNKLQKKETPGLCTQQILYSENVKEYADLVEGIIKPLSPKIEDANEVLGIVKQPLYAILVLDEKDYSLFTDEKTNSKEDIELGINDFKKIQGLDDKGIRQLLLKQKRVTLETPLAYWSMLPQDLEFMGIKLVKGGCYVVIRPELIEKLSNKLKTRLADEKITDLEKALFRVTLIHELGHHYSLSNLLPDNWPITSDSKYINDINFAEGLANLFAHRVLSPEERRVLAEMAVEQPACYKLYLDLRYYEKSNSMLKILMIEKDYIKALKVFSELMPNKLLMGSGTWTVEKADAFFDCSKGGGNILAGEIDFLFPYKGYVIAAKIHNLIGRYSNDSLIISNAIDNHPDYVILPRNIIVIDKDEYDLEKIIKKHQIGGLQGKELVKAVLREIKIGNNAE